MKKYTLLIISVLLSSISYSQGHFIPAFTGFGNNQMNINILLAKEDGLDLQAGDEIAVFDVLNGRWLLCMWYLPG